jgi:MOSC domain-containing protein YiiM
MRILSVNVGLPRQLPTVATSIFKSPVEGRVRVRRHNLDGDRQADLTVHGGPHKAVYCYPGEHYDYWRKQLPGVVFSSGMFGENLTTEGLLEDEVWIGDQFRTGTAVLQVSQPRMPCFKLGIRFDRPDMVKLFWHSDRPGIYFAVVEEGDIAAGDPIEKVAQSPAGVSVADVVRLYRGIERSQDLLERALRAPLPGSWKQELRERAAQRAD